MEVLSLVVSIVAFAVSAYFSYLPYREKRKALFQKLCLYEKTFQDLLEDWQDTKEWISKLGKDAADKKNLKFSIIYKKDVFDLYPLTSQNEDILASLGVYSETAEGNDDKSEMPFLSIRQLIHDFSVDSWPMRNGYIEYEFVSLDLAVNYLSKNGNSEGKKAEYILRLIGQAKNKLV